MGKNNSFLLIRGKIFYFNAWLPIEARSFFGNAACIRKSLKTSDAKSASKMARALAVNLEQLIIRIRSRMYSNDEIKRWVKEFFSPKFWLFEAYSAAGGFNNCNLEKRKSGYIEWEAIVRKDLATGNLERVAKDAGEWLASQNIDINHEDLEFKYFCREILKAEIQFYRILQKRMDGDYGMEYTDLDSPLGILNIFDNHNKHSETKPAQSQTIRPPSKTEGPNRPVENFSSLSDTTPKTQPEKVEVLLDEAINKYFSSFRSDNRVKSKSIDEFESFCRLFLEIVGNKPIRSIDDDVITNFMTILARIPRNRNKDQRWRNFTALELSKMDIKETFLMSDTTINKYIQRISSFLNYCCKKRRWIEFNPAEGRRFSRTNKRKGKKHEDRLPYEKEELQELINQLGSLKKTEDFKKHPERFFIPLIALFAGLRQQEICQLYLEDVRQAEGIWVFDVNEKTPDKSLKTESSTRLVPIHPILIDIGFFEYFEKIKKTRNDRLWPNLTHTKKWGYRRKFSHWFYSFNRRCLSEDLKKVFHSLRHNFSNCLRQDIVSLDVRESLLGHLQPQLANIVYAEPLHPQKLLEDGIKKIDYDLNLSPILPPGSKRLGPQ